MLETMSCLVILVPSTVTVTVTSIVNFHVPSNDFFVVELIRIIINFNLIYLFPKRITLINLGYNLGYHHTLVMSYDLRYVRDPKTNAKQYSNNRLIYTYVMSYFTVQYSLTTSIN